MQMPLLREACLSAKMAYRDSPLYCAIRVIFPAREMMPETSQK